MQNEGIIGYFHLICTDGNPNIPTHIKMTPTILIKGIPTPYSGKDTFVWLSKVKQWKMNMMLRNVSSQQKQYISGINSNLVLDNNPNLLGFSASEMEGMSDMFSYWVNNWGDTNENNESTMPHAFVTCDQLGNDNIFCVPHEKKHILHAEDHIIQQKKLLIDRRKQDAELKGAIDNFRKQYDT
jgi:hypothetical protein